MRMHLTFDPQLSEEIRRTTLLHQQYVNISPIGDVNLSSKPALTSRYHCKPP